MADNCTKCGKTEGEAASCDVPNCPMQDGDGGDNEDQGDKD